jgi:hypothetical protein
LPSGDKLEAVVGSSKLTFFRARYSSELSVAHLLDALAQ